jgi:hypothetical protein
VLTISDALKPLAVQTERGGRHQGSGRQGETVLVAIALKHVQLALSIYTCTKNVACKHVGTCPLTTFNSHIATYM